MKGFLSLHHVLLSACGREFLCAAMKIYYHSNVDWTDKVKIFRDSEPDMDHIEVS